jgi:hypothetical protein
VSSHYAETASIKYDESVNGDKMNESPSSVIRLQPNITAVQMSQADRDKAVKAAHYRTLSPHEWEWTPEQQADMALYCLWASQRLAAMKSLANGVELKSL